MYLKAKLSVWKVNNMINLLIVDDHLVVGEGTKRLLEEESDFKVQVVSSSKVASELIKTKKFDVYLLDLQMPELNGLELTREIKNTISNAKIIIYTGHDIAAHFNYLVEIGVSGFISKTTSKKQFIRSIRCALDEEVVLPLDLLFQLRRTETQVMIEGGEEVSLTSREEEILLKVAKGMNNDEIAEELYMSKRNVERSLTSIFKKLKVDSRVDLIIKGRELGIIPEVIL